MSNYQKHVDSWVDGARFIIGASIIGYYFAGEALAWMGAGPAEVLRPVFGWFAVFFACAYLWNEYRLKSAAAVSLPGPKFPGP